MARRQTRTSGWRQKRGWGLLKLLLVLAYGAVIVFIGAIFVMEKELRRFGIFGAESAAVHTPKRQLSPERERTLDEVKPSESAAQEITPEEKKQLEAILRERGER